MEILQSKSDSLGIPSPFGCASGWKAWSVSQSLNNSGRTSLLLLFISLLVTKLADVKFDFIMIVPLLSSHCSFFFVFEGGTPFYFILFFWWVSASSCWWLFNKLAVIFLLSQVELRAYSILPSWTNLLKLALFFFLKFALAIQGLLCFHIILELLF